MTRAHALSAHYTDNGIWPRDAAETALGEFGFSFHLLGGSAAFQVMLFVIAGLLALLVIYCDAPCEFCLKTCQLLRTFLLFESTPVRPAQEHPEIGPLLEAENSWVVVDHDGRRYLRWSAMVLVFRRSWLLGPVAGLFDTASAV